ncbi:MAG: NAD(P)(+) transhydrogenase (Re/Si-specific) subunit beta [Deltaproteobacteria bacterium]|nr:NAD(P)(+) transhydrogenase (Re/Si-specific) subunit beta [Deltaproteobacteria bacterium]MCB9480032.1 NAD(P)(+) transhydrogenase (Re/Si-specific) subunit beta [Deltaproteobacteria bacterium]MCB9489577.1 NAD(P)(+) transhydrogenase (Re/Si-specific) subunit beta [Deltaproteobacteria bacterium]
MQQTLIYLAYMLSTALFILGLKRMGKVKTAVQGNLLASVAMAIAIVATLFDLQILSWVYIVAGLVIGSGIGAWFALRVEMTAMPQMVALFNGFGGLASLLVATSYFFGEVLERISADLSPDMLIGMDSSVTVGASILIGGITFTGSIVAWGKLEGRITEAPVRFTGQHLLNLILVLSALGTGYCLAFSVTGFWGSLLVLTILAVLALALGVLLVIPIGGADMPVVISLLNSYSGIAAAMAGFVIGDNLLIVGGALVGSAGLILTQIMCKAMNRSLANVLFGGFGATASASSGKEGYNNVKSTDPESAAMILDAASKVIIAPGYGMAVGQAQHAVKEFTDLMEKRGCEVLFAIHPVAGRMPGHMNVLLAEANIDYDKLVEMEKINSDFKNADVAIVLGANDVVNPAALDEKDSPIYGMPILNVHEARTVFVIKRSLSPGFAGIKNRLFEAENTNMIYGDAKQVMNAINEELKASE